VDHIEKPFSGTGGNLQYTGMPSCIRERPFSDTVHDPDYAVSDSFPEKNGGRKMKTAVLILTMSIVTILLRALPFLVFHRKVPSYIAYLGRVLPPAIIGMLVDLLPEGRITSESSLCIAGACFCGFGRAYTGLETEFHSEHTVRYGHLYADHGRHRIILQHMSEFKEVEP
jgi:hypothetical protein